MSRRSYSEIASRRGIERKKRNESTERNEYSDELFEIEMLSSRQPFFPSSLGSPCGFRFSNVSLFSSGNVQQSIYTANLIGSFFHTDEFPSLRITDGTSCIGGNTWAFATMFGTVNAVEIHPLHMSMLQTNMKQLGVHSCINYYNENYLNVISHLCQDVIFLDPPWGGMKYRTHPRVGLMTEEGWFVSIKDMLQLIPLSTQVIVLKVPKNYSTYGLQKEGYPIKKVISLRTGTKIEGTTKDKVLYKLVILSKIETKRKVMMPVFSPLRYKALRFCRKNE
jgi:hypothetical protein